MPADQDKALTEAIKLADKTPQARTARSLNARQMRKKERSGWVVTLETTGLIIAGTPIFLFFEGEWDLAVWLWKICFVVGPVMWVAGWLLGKRAAVGYEDPQLEVSATAEGIRVANPVQAHRIAYAAAELAVLPGSGNTAFGGIALATPLGALTLDDAHFKEGRIVAAQILACREAVGAGTAAAT